MESWGVLVGGLRVVVFFVPFFRYRGMEPERTAARPKRDSYVRWSAVHDSYPKLVQGSNGGDTR
ncbi:uncharacterized protein THITE_2116386 [Thermothielavioides terrestris NRRL 8126]|uniref:Uncharacterized protein n=1 Tax=Thermothielavioides terrestris (strain ATCC 38088 / NRRL 8126) TaxID=578455 RepID=G2R5R6_THETT|nr:uncharacterized protein THITE_2116386 [Thermothielavioides terrestris NRRL 8126]AEO67505.1 hypothetical protein THITE_2116386 [Thermothielavioides terrestris NRRL 8126]